MPRWQLLAEGASKLGRGVMRGNCWFRGKEVGCGAGVGQTMLAASVSCVPARACISKPQMVFFQSVCMVYLVVWWLRPD
jgi:hypothetical protein